MVKKFGVPKLSLCSALLLIWACLFVFSVQYGLSIFWMFTFSVLMGIRYKEGINQLNNDLEGVDDPTTIRYRLRCLTLSGEVFLYNLLAVSIYIYGYVIAQWQWMDAPINLDAALLIRSYDLVQIISFSDVFNPYQAPILFLLTYLHVLAYVALVCIFTIAGKELYHFGKHTFKAFCNYWGSSFHRTGLLFLIPFLFSEIIIDGYCERYILVEYPGYHLGDIIFMVFMLTFIQPLYFFLFFKFLSYQIFNWVKPRRQP